MKGLAIRVYGLGTRFGVIIWIKFKGLGLRV